MSHPARRDETRSVRTDLPVTLERHLDRCAAERPDKTAIVDGQGRYTYGELACAVERIAHGLRAQGVEPAPPSRSSSPTGWFKTGDRATLDATATSPSPGGPRT